MSDDPTARNSKRLPVKAKGEVETDLEHVLRREGDGRIAAARFQFFEHGRNLCAQKGRNDSGRRFVGSQPVGVGGAHDRGFEQAVVPVDGRHDVDQKGDELEVLRRRLARPEQVDARVSAQRPVVVFARTVDPLEGLLVEQDAEVVAAGDLVHDRHQQLVVVVGQVGFLVNGRQLELVGRHFVVAGFDGNAQPERFVFQVAHEFDHAFGNRAEIVVFELLVLGRFVAHERATRQHQVGACGPQRFVHEEVLLLPAQVAENLRDVAVEVAAYFRRGPVDGCQRAQQRGLVVERLARIGDEHGRDAERRADDEGGRRGVPGGVAARFERVADSAVGERRGIGFLLDEQLAGELFEHAAPSVGFGEGVVFLGGSPRERLEPVGVVVGAVLHRPLLHACGDAVGHFAREGRAVFHGLDQRFVGLAVEIPPHDVAPEDQLPEIIGRTSGGSLCGNRYVAERLFDHPESQRCHMSLILNEGSAPKSQEKHWQGPRLRQNAPTGRNQLKKPPLRC